MSLRCGCSSEGDEIVFGPIHECSKEEACVCRASGVRKCPVHRTHLPPLVPSWRFVVPETSGGVYDPDLQEARIHQTLGEDELHD